jgi:hypothetical protein
MPPLLWISDFPIPGGPAWQGDVNLSLDRIYGDMMGGLFAVAIVSAASILCTAIWLLVVRAHLRSAHGHVG